MQLTVKTNEENYFRFLLEVLSAFKPFNTLRVRERDVLSRFLYYNHLYREIPEEERFLLIFSTTIRKKIEKSLGMSAETMANYLSLLRQRGFILDNKIPRGFLFKFKDSVNIKFD